MKKSKEEKRNLVRKIYNAVGAICAAIGFLFIISAQANEEIFGGPTTKFFIIGIIIISIGFFIILDHQKYCKEHNIDIND